MLGRNNDGRRLETEVGGGGIAGAQPAESPRPAWGDNVGHVGVCDCVGVQGDSWLLLK
jgi:hypothetical protein